VNAPESATGPADDDILDDETLGEVSGGVSADVFRGASLGGIRRAMIRDTGVDPLAPTTD
jgi:hypothetical protein